jgi:uncharacterized OB-fold protein
MMDTANDLIEPVHKGLVTSGEKPGQVALLGSKCNKCGEVSLGTNPICLNCACEDTETITLSEQGILYTYTVVRHKPPGNYLGPDPFEPFALGLVELPDGIRVMAPLDVNLDEVEIGMKLQLKPWLLTGSPEKTYEAFKFSAA